MTAESRIAELKAAAPVRERGRWARVGGRVYLCGTLGVEFDRWQRALSLRSAADALFAQQLGLEAVERLMDRLEDEARAEVEATGAHLARRVSPGYGKWPLELSREILQALDATRQLGVTLSESLLLIPSKSVTALCEVTA